MQKRIIVGIIINYIINSKTASESIEKVIKEVTGGKVDISFCFWLMIVALYLIPFVNVGTPKNLRYIFNF